MTGPKIRQQLEQCIQFYQAGTLSEQMLQAALETAQGSDKKCQDLLYLQAGSTSLTSQVHGMLLMQDGEVADEVPDADDWPYQTVLEAIRDGWRVVQFPNQALLLDETRTFGLGSEFILEK